MSPSKPPHPSYRATHTKANGSTRCFPRTRGKLFAGEAVIYRPSDMLGITMMTAGAQMLSKAKRLNIGGEIQMARGMPQS